MSDDDDSPLEQVVAGVVVGGILLTAFTLLALGVPWFWVAFPVGFAGVLPAAIGLVRLYERRRVDDESAPDTGEEAALETLRDRYARGELTEAEFEARIERLLETESVADARDYVERRHRDREAGGDAEPVGGDPARTTTEGGDPARTTRDVETEATSGTERRE